MKNKYNLILDNVFYYQNKMYIKKIFIDGLHSFENFEIKPKEKINIIVGTNGTGKTNFITTVHNALLYFCHYKNGHNDMFENKKYFDDSKNKDKWVIKIDINVEPIILDSLENFIFLRILANQNNTKKKYIDDNYVKNKLKINKIQIHVDSDEVKLIINDIEQIEYNTFNSIAFIDFFVNTDLSTSKIFENYTNEMDKMLKIFKLYDTENKSDVVGYLTTAHANYNHFNAERIQFRHIEIAIANYIEENLYAIGIKQKTRILKKIEDLVNPVIDKLYKEYLKEHNNRLINLTCHVPEQNNNLNDITMNIIKNEANEEEYMDLLMKYDTDMRINFIYNNMDAIERLGINGLFKMITNKTFVMNEYQYYIVETNKRCSKGEIELIKFLILYCLFNVPVLLIDEPCKGLSTTNRDKFRQLILENTDFDKQIFMVIHDEQLISENNCDSIIKFNLDENRKTKSYPIKLTEEEKKMIFEAKSILFADRCLLVEGYDDYRFMKYFLKVCEEIDDKFPLYKIIMLGGCGSKLWEILDRLNINYKIIYDCDKILIKDKRVKKRKY